MAALRRGVWRTVLVGGEKLVAAGLSSNGRCGPYAEVITNDVGCGRYFEATRNRRLFILTHGSTAVSFGGHTSPIPAGGTPLWALFNPPSTRTAAVILRASILVTASGQAIDPTVPVLPVWNFLTNLAGLTDLGVQGSVAGLIDCTGSSNAGSMRNFNGRALTGGTVAHTFVRNWMGSFNDPRTVGTLTDTSAGVLTEDTDGSIIVPPGVILSVAMNAQPVALRGFISVLYAEIDWPL